MARGTIGLGASNSGITPVSGTVDIGTVSGTVEVTGTINVQNVPNDYLETAQVGSYYVVTSSGAHQVSSVPGALLKLHYITLASGSNLTIFDSTSVLSDDVMIPRHSTTEQEVPGNVPFTVFYGLKFSTGLLLDVTGSLTATVVYQENV